MGLLIEVYTDRLLTEGPPASVGHQVEEGNMI